MTASASQPSLWTALRHSAADSRRAARQMTGAARDATSIVTAAIREHRGVARSTCLAVEQTARAAVRITRAFQEENVAAWQRVALIGTGAAWSIGVGARITVGLLSLLVATMIACDVLLNTAAEWRTLHPRVR